MTGSLVESRGRKLYADDLERVAIGSLLTYPNTKPVFDRYGGARLFWRESSRWFWKAVEAITRELGPTAVLDGSSIVAWLESRGAWTESGGARAFQDVRQHAVPAAGCETVARQLRELADRREFVRLTSVVRELAFDGAARDEILAEVQNAIRTLAAPTTARSAHEIATEIRQRHDSLMAGEIDQAAIESTGIPWLDFVLGGGIKATHSYYVAGLKKIGKTKLIGYLVWALLRRGWRVDWYSVEMTEVEMMTRLLSCEANVSETRITNGSVDNPADYERFVEAEFATKGWKYRHQSPRPWKAEDIVDSAQHYILDNPDDRVLVVVDYIQECTVRDTRGMKEHQVISQASSTLNGFAKTMGIPIVIASQISEYKLEKRGGNEKFTPVPRSSDVRGSGDIAQHANHLVILHRPWWQLHGVDSRFTVVDLALTRSGGNRRLYLYSDLTYNRYHPWGDGEESGDIPRPFDVLYGQGEEPWRADTDG